jgi:hypothetical protein
MQNLLFDIMINYLANVIAHQGVPHALVVIPLAELDGKLDLMPMIVI